MAEIQNSNPTILNAADLPSRLRPAPTGKATYSGIFAPSLPDTSDLFSPSPLSSSESEGEDDLMEEPIDEQEIYGRDFVTRRFYSKTLTLTDTLPSFLSRLDIYNLRPRTPHLPR